MATTRVIKFTTTLPEGVSVGTKAGLSGKRRTGDILENFFQGVSYSERVESTEPVTLILEVPEAQREATIQVLGGLLRELSRSGA